ncbi:MAG: (d)CMP kinase [Nocardioides sp.]
MTTDIVVAIDGPSGSGKSSTSRGVAERLGLRYLDTGAMFRAITWWMLGQGIDVTDASAIAGEAMTPRVVAGTDPREPTITVDGVDVAEAIRSPAVTAAVSAVSAVPTVRALLLAEQRAIIGAGGIVVEGRDIGSVVAPDAAVKIFLTADPMARAQRRSREQGGGSVQATESSLLERDRIDSARAASPLTMPTDAHHLDTTTYTLDEVIELVTTRVRAARRPDPA